MSSWKKQKNDLSHINSFIIMFSHYREYPMNKITAIKTSLFL